MKKALISAGCLSFLIVIIIFSILVSYSNEKKSKLSFYQNLTRVELLNEANDFLKNEQGATYTQGIDSSIFNKIVYYPNVNGDQIIIAAQDNKIVLLYIRSFWVKRIFVNNRDCPITARMYNGRYYPEELQRLKSFYNSLNQEEYGVLCQTIQWLYNTESDRVFLKILLDECLFPMQEPTL